MPDRIERVDAEGLARLLRRGIGLIVGQETTLPGALKTLNEDLAQLLNAPPLAWYQSTIENGLQLKPAAEDAVLETSIRERVYKLENCRPVRTEAVSLAGVPWKCVLT